MASVNSFNFYEDRLKFLQNTLGTHKELEKGIKPERYEAIEKTMQEINDFHEQAKKRLSEIGQAKLREVRNIKL